MTPKVKELIAGLYGKAPGLIYGVCHGFVNKLQSSRAKYLLIRSVRRGDELHQSWQELYLCRKDDEDCKTRFTESEGNWVVAREFSREERWRFSNGDWSVDVELGTGISYAEAETMVRSVAVRPWPAACLRMEWLGKCWPLTSGKEGFTECALPMRNARRKCSDEAGGQVWFTGE